MTDEIIDTLARILGGDELHEKVKAITNQAMGSKKIPFEDSLRQRVDLLMEKGLSRNTIQRAIETMKFSEGFVDLLKNIITTRQSLEGQVFILSGGFEEVICGVIDAVEDIDQEQKDVLKNQVHANTFVYDEDGRVTGVDWESERNKMWTPTAKPDRVARLREQGEIAEDAQILGTGDGSNDVGMVPEGRGVNAAYVGIEGRSNTILEAGRVYLRNFYEVWAMLLRKSEADALPAQSIIASCRELLEKRFSTSPTPS